MVTSKIRLVIFYIFLLVHKFHDSNQYSWWSQRQRWKIHFKVRMEEKTQQWTLCTWNIDQKNSLKKKEIGFAEFTLEMNCLQDAKSWEHFLLNEPWRWLVAVHDYRPVLRAVSERWSCSSRGQQTLSKHTAASLLGSLSFIMQTQQLERSIGFTLQQGKVTWSTRKSTRKTSVICLK